MNFIQSGPAFPMAKILDRVTARHMGGVKRGCSQLLYRLVMTDLNPQALEVYQLATRVRPLVVVEPDLVIKNCSPKGTKSFPVCTHLDGVLFSFETIEVHTFGS